MESLDDAFSVLNTLEKDLSGENQERAKRARERLVSNGETHDSPVIRYAATRITNPEAKTNLGYSFRIWLHESAEKDIAAISICSIITGFIGLVGYYAYHILSK